MPSSGHVGYGRRASEADFDVSATRSPKFQGLTRGHRCLGKRRCDDLVQLHVDASVSVDNMQGRKAAQDRGYGHRMLAGFVSRVLRKHAKIN